MAIDDGFFDMLEFIKNNLSGIDVSDVSEHIAIHVNVTDMGNRPFYIEVNPGSDIKVEPYGYYNKDATINADSRILMDMIDKKSDIRFEFTNNRIGAFGNLYKLSILRDLIVNQL